MKLIPTAAKDLKDGDWILVEVGRFEGRPGCPMLVRVHNPDYVFSGKPNRPWEIRINDHEDNYVAWVDSDHLLNLVVV